MPRGERAKGDPNLWGHREKLTLGFSSKTFLGLTIHVEKSEILGKKLKFQKPILSTIEDNGYSLIYKGCNALKWQEMDSNQSGTVGGTILGLFKGSLINLGASGWTAPKPKSGDSGADFDIP